MNNVQTTPEPATHVSRQLCTLGEYTHRLTELVTLLRQKLAPVTRPCPITAQPPTAAEMAQPVIAPLAYLLRTENERLEKNLGELTEAIDHLEI